MNQQLKEGKEGKKRPKQPLEMVPIRSRELTRAGLEHLPAAIGRAGHAAAWRFIEFFTATIRNQKYARRVCRGGLAILRLVRTSAYPFGQVIVPKCPYAPLWKNPILPCRCMVWSSRPMLSCSQTQFGARDK